MSGTVLIDACACVGNNTITTKETGFWLNIKADNQLLATDGGIALRIRFGAAPVFGEVKAGYADLIAVDLGRRAATAAAGTAPCVGISVLPGAGIGCLLYTSDAADEL